EDKAFPIDYHSSGVTLKKTQWDCGSHQFTQLKHQLPLTDLSLVTNFLSVTNHFQLYKSIYGLTGTLGYQSENEYLEKTFGVDCIYIPSFKTRKLIELSPIS